MIKKLVGIIYSIIIFCLKASVLLFGIVSFTALIAYNTEVYLWWVTSYVVDTLVFVGEVGLLYAISQIYPLLVGGRKNEKPIFKFIKNGFGIFGSYDKEDTNAEFEIAFNYLATNKFNSYMVCTLWYSVEFFETIVINAYLSPFRLLGAIKGSAILGFFNLRVSHFNTIDLLTYYEYIAIRLFALFLKLYAYMILSIFIIASFICVFFYFLNFFVTFWYSWYTIPVTSGVDWTMSGNPFDRLINMWCTAFDFSFKTRMFSEPLLVFSDKLLIDSFLLILPEILLFLFSFYILIKSLSLLELTKHRSAYTKFVLKLWTKIETVTYLISCVTAFQLLAIRINEGSLIYLFKHYRFLPWTPRKLTDHRTLFHKYRFFLFDNLLIYDVFYLGAKLFFLILFIIFIKLLRLTLNTFYIVQPEQPFLITALLFFFLVALMSIDLNLLYICFEAITIIIVVLIAQEYSEFSVDAAVKYFSLNAITSGLFLFGTSIFYGYTLATEFLSISEFFFIQSLLIDCCDLTPILFASTLIIISFFIKLAIWPGSLWVFDVYAGCSIALLFLVSVVLKIVVFFIFIRVLLFAFLYLFFYWKLLLLLSAVGSLIFSAIGLSLETKLNSFIAYSSIGQFGFMLLGFISYQNVQSLNSILLYLVSYCTAISSIFLVLPIIFGRSYGNNNISHFIGLYKKSFFISFVLTVFLASLAGLPPFLGFFVKYRVLKVVVSSAFSFGLIMLILFTTTLTIYGYFRLISFIWFDYAGKGFGSLGSYNTFEGSLFSLDHYNKIVRNIWDRLNIRIRGVRLSAYLDTPWYKEVSSTNKYITRIYEFFFEEVVIRNSPHPIYSYFFGDIGKNWLKDKGSHAYLFRRLISSFAKEEYLIQFTAKYGLFSLIVFFIFFSLHIFGFFTIWFLSNITEYYAFHFFYPNVIDSRTWFIRVTHNAWRYWWRALEFSKI